MSKKPSVEHTPLPSYARMLSDVKEHVEKQRRAAAPPQLTPDDIQAATVSDFSLTVAERTRLAGRLNAILLTRARSESPARLEIGKVCATCGGDSNRHDMTCDGIAPPVEERK